MLLIFSRRMLATLCVLALLSATWPLASTRADTIKPPPTLLAPADGVVTTAASDPPLAIPEFRWGSVPGTTNYRIQFSQDIAFTTKVEALISNPSYTPTDANKFPDGIWYWRVRADMPAPASEYSEIRAFTKQWASPDQAPALIAPADGASLAFYDAPAFSWQPVTGAASYRFQIAASSDGFGSPRYNQTTLAPSHRPATKLANGTYYWRVIPLDPASREGVASEVRSFTADYNLVPTLLEPADGATPTFTPTFRWTAVAGAQLYRLQYSTDPTFSAGVTTVDTRQTAYTPATELPNDVNYYWRVRVHSGNSISEWSAIYTFVKRWYLAAQLLTPPNNYQHVRLPPLFNWTPVPGASYYKLEVNNAPSFPPGQQGWTATTANPFWVRPDFDKLPSYTNWYWRVTPYDRHNNAGQPSEVFSFGYNGSAQAPYPIYPFYYYAPPTALQPHEDRTVPWPVFIWGRITYLQTQIAAYRVQVDDDPLFGSVDWTADTANLSATPTSERPFTPTIGRDYFWRVRPLDAVGGNEIGQWSMAWRARFDANLAPPLLLLTLLHPTHAAESVETSPLLEWQPLTGADSYDVQISSDPDFNLAYLVDSASVPYPVYTPTGRLPYGTYYWRVMGRAAGLPLGDWSAAWRFQVAAGSHWQEPRTPGSSANRQLVAFDPYGDMLDANYDLSTLYAVQSKDYWFFGFNACTGADDMVYALYFDLDHADGSGASVDPRGYNVATIPAHRPEYAIYVPQVSGVFTASQATVYRWTGSAWAVPQRLDEVGGSLHYDLAGHYLELRVPNTVIGMQETTGSASMALFSLMWGGGHAQDTVPSDPNVSYTLPDPGGETTTLSRFTSVSERLTTAWPPTSAVGDSTTYTSLLPFAWHLPVDAPWHGFNLQVAVDPNFTSPILTYLVKYNLASYAPFIYTHNKDLNGDNTYYWRVRPVYDASGNFRGSWSAAGVFERSGFTPQNLRTSVAFATPTFSWDMVEGAEAYELQVDDDPNFGSTAVSVTTSRNSYTPTGTLAQGVYYWRVRARRYSNIFNGWTASQTFTLALPEPTGLTHSPAPIPPRAPTLCWTPLVASADDQPVFTAWKYRVQVSREPTFSSVYDTVDTEQACWTPTKGYDDGGYYWRVAAIDGEGKLGRYGAAAEFTKQYPMPTLLSPAHGSAVSDTPTFAWTPVTGAASYKLEVSLNPTFSPVYDSATTNNARVTPAKRYEAEQIYYWRVAMVDKDKKAGPFVGEQVAVVEEVKRYLPWVAGSW